MASTCENPQFPSWMWRYNRNQHLSRYEPWFVRDERMPPNYRNMGVKDNFRFHPISPDETPRPFQTLGVNYCRNAVVGREAGFGNSAIGRTPGPAPPRLVLYNVAAPFQNSDLYKINEIDGISPGFTLIGEKPLGRVEDDQSTMPLNPSYYLEQTLGQPARIPGTFPHFNKAMPSNLSHAARSCSMLTDKPLNPMDVWRHNYARQQARHARERCRTTYNMMNDWMRLQGRVANKAGPVMYNGGDGFQEMPSVVMADTDNEAAKQEQDEKFEHTYSQLAHQIAYRYPNPGLPRIRQGAIGGTWRHIKEVLGHHGSRVCFVDGLVSVYDTDRFSEALQPPLPYKGKLVHPPFAPTRDEFANSKKSVTFPPVERQRTASAPRHKGHYQFK